MAQPTEAAALMVLLRSGFRPSAEWADLLEDEGSARAALERVAGELPPGQAQMTLSLSGPAPPSGSLQTGEDELDRWRRDGIELVSVLDHGYPPNLRAVHDRPPALFVAGALQPGDQRSLAVIGSREASPAGLEAARTLVAHLARERFTIVSGLAAGIDTAAHVAALELGARTVAVIGTGLEHAYPRQNAALQRRIARDGAVISQFWPATPPSRKTFPMRNAVMSGVSLGTVIVEASQTSGARIQARQALRHGRPVFLRRALLAQVWARELAARPGVHVIDSPQEITAAVERLNGAGALVA